MTLITLAHRHPRTAIPVDSFTPTAAPATCRLLPTLAAPVLFFLVASALLPGPAAIGSTASVANGAAPPVWGTTVQQREKR